MIVFRFSKDPFMQDFCRKGPVVAPLRWCQRNSDACHFRVVPASAYEEVCRKCRTDPRAPIVLGKLLEAPVAPIPWQQVALDLVAQPNKNVI